MCAGDVRGHDLGVVQAAVDAWRQCQPRGVTIPEERLPSLLPRIAAFVPGGGDSPQKALRLGEAFGTSGPSGEARRPPFVRDLEPREGKVHFLHFWRAFSTAAVRVAGDAAQRSGPLAAELEIFRDVLLYFLAAERTIPASALVDAVHRAAARSAVPEFWRSAARSAHSLEGATELGPEELAEVLLSWLPPARGDEPQTEKSALPPIPRASASKKSKEMRKIGPTGTTADRGCAGSGLPVYIHVYDVSHEDAIRKLNAVLAHKKSPMKLGGVFHAGVEVGGLEWSYGFNPRPGATGIVCDEPRVNFEHRYRQSIYLGTTGLSQSAVAGMISDLVEEYQGAAYSLLKFNCCTFADDFCRRLGVGGIPKWVHRLARVGARLEGMVKKARSLSRSHRAPHKDKAADASLVPRLPSKATSKVHPEAWSFGDPWDEICSPVELHAL